MRMCMAFAVERFGPDTFHANHELLVQELKVRACLMRANDLIRKKMFLVALFASLKESFLLGPSESVTLVGVLLTDNTD